MNKSTKICPQCKRELDRATGFHRRRKSLDSCQTYCRDCQRKRVDLNQQQAHNRELHTKAMRTYRECHREQLRDYGRAYYKKHRERVCARNTARQRANRERQRAAQTP